MKEIKVLQTSDGDFFEDELNKLVKKGWTIKYESFLMTQVNLYIMQSIILVRE